MQKSINTFFEVAVIYEENNNKEGFACWHYRVIPENYYHVDLGEYHTYGIQVTGADCVKILHDVSACERTVSRIVELFNRHQLSPVHFQDAVEDILP